MKVRIKKSPREREMDGIKLDAMKPGMVREVSACIGTWLIVEGYAEPEMRQTPDVPRMPDPRTGTPGDRRRRDVPHS